MSEDSRVTGQWAFADDIQRIFEVFSMMGNA